MASSVSRQDELNPAMLLATQAGKMVLSCPLRLTHCLLYNNSVLFAYNKSFSDQACSVEMAGIGFVLF